MTSNDRARFAVVHTPAMATAVAGSPWELAVGDLLHLHEDGTVWAEGIFGGYFGLAVPPLGDIAWGFADLEPAVAYLRTLDTASSRTHLRILGREVAEVTPERPRCEHGFARVSDGKCRKCDEGTPTTQVTHATLPLERAKVTVGVTAGGNVARRSLYDIAEALGLDASDYRVRAELRGEGIDALTARLEARELAITVVPAASL